MDRPGPRNVVFDVGNVLVRWDPRNLYRKIFTEADEMEQFLAFVCTPAWNLEQDRGRDWDEAVALLVAEHPHHAPSIRAFHDRWDETISGSIDDNVSLLQRLQGADVPTYCITNFSSPKFLRTKERYPFLSHFRGTIVSGDERVVKPDAAIYELLLKRYGLVAQDCVFIDDSQANVAGARAVGMHAILYRDGTDVGEALRGLGIAAA